MGEDWLLKVLSSIQKGEKYETSRVATPESEPICLKYCEKGNPIKT